MTAKWNDGVTDAVADLIAGEPEVIAGGFTYTEGPAWDPFGGSLYFNDVPADTTYALAWGGDPEVLAHPSGYANGMAAGPEGALLICVSGENRIVRRERDGERSVLASHYHGYELNSPNDLVLHSSGDVYFTDPAYGRIPIYGRDRPQELEFQGVYRLDATGELELISADCQQPNGLCLSPDERWLYVADTEDGCIVRFDLQADGDPARELFVERAGAPLSFGQARRNELVSGYVDGMGCDERGNVYVTAPGGIAVFDESARPLGTIPFDEDLANFTWGGPGGRSLFVCCRSRVLRLELNVRSAGAAA